MGIQILLALKHLLVFLVLFLLPLKEIRILAGVEAKGVKVIVEGSETEAITNKIGSIEVSEVVELVHIEVNEFAALVQVREVLVGILWILVWFDGQIPQRIRERVVRRLSTFWLLKLS